MKKIFAFIALLGVLSFGNVNAQKVAKAAKDTTGMAAKRAARAAKRAEKKAAKAQAAATAAQTSATQTAQQAPVKATKAVKMAPAAKTAATQAVNTSSDKAIGTDAKGRTIYEGPRGGHYVLSASGKKEYIKKTK